MPGGFKIHKPERLEKQGVSEGDLQAWWNELFNYMGQDTDLYLFKKNGFYATWEAFEVNEDRILARHANDIDNESTLPKRRQSLNNFLTAIAGCCHRSHYMMIIKQATSFTWIYDELKTIYGLHTKGKEFLSIVKMKFNPNVDSAITFYTEYRNKILENLHPAGTTFQWSGKTQQQQEVMSHTFEDHVLVTSLHLMNSRLPELVYEKYGPRMKKGDVLMDFKTDILKDVSKMLEDAPNDDDEETNINSCSSCTE